MSMSASSPRVRPEFRKRITIFAATGGIGHQALEQALASGHEVTAVVRNPGKVSRDVRKVAADLADVEPAKLESAIAGSDAVLSGLGARSGSDIGVAWRGTLTIVRAMYAAGVNRLIVVSAAPVGAVASPGRPDPPRDDPGDGFFMRHLFAPFARTAFRKRYEDLARMEDVVRESGLDWTIIRPPRLTNGPRTGAFRTEFGKNIRGGFRVSRADVALFMLRALEAPETIHQTVGIAY
ncbi:MAG TPA: SDR family oxidoreductase [Thermoanaerobaculia bacterium]|nr:SDR family oxidoreductase [Thermoanaerobaculia bacterium]